MPRGVSRDFSTSLAKTAPTAALKTLRSGSPTTASRGVRPWPKGRWTNDPSFKHVALPGAFARYVELRGLSEVEGRPIMSAAELSVDTSTTK